MRQWLRRRWTPATAAFLLAPACTELLSGNMPPLVFFVPPVYLMLAILYGGGAILAHDLVVRWGKGWPSLLALAIAYGVWEEGVLVRSLFNPEWGGRTEGGDYGWWLGVSWIETGRLVLFHATFAILIPVLLIGTIFPNRREQPWLSPRRTRILLALMLIQVPVGWLMMPYTPGIGAYALTIGVVAALIGIARLLPSPRGAHHAARGWSRRLFFTGFGATAALFLLGWVMPAVGVPASLTVPLLVGLGIACVVQARRIRPTRDGLLALASGALAFWVLAAPISELTGRRGMLLVGLATALLLRRLARHVAQPNPTSARLNALTVSSGAP